jgi:hypothetical protein
MAIGLQRNMIFSDGIYERWAPYLEQCPSIGSLIVPMSEWSRIRRHELRFDYAGNMIGTTGKYVTFYRAVQTWLASKTKRSKTPSAEGVKIKQHA